MTESLLSVAESNRPEDVGPDLLAFAERHDLAVGEARRIILEAGCDSTKAETLAHRMKKW